MSNHLFFPVLLLTLSLSLNTQACISAQTNDINMKIVSKTDGGYKVIIASQPVWNGSKKKAGPTTYKTFKDDDGFFLLKALSKKKAGEEGVSPQDRKLATDVARFYLKKLKDNKKAYMKGKYFRGTSADYDDAVREVSQQISNLNGTPNLQKTIKSIFSVAEPIESDLRKHAGGHSYHGFDGPVKVSDVFPANISRSIGGCSNRATSLKTEVGDGVLDQQREVRNQEERQVHKTSIGR